MACHYHPCRVIRLGLRDVYPRSGKAAELLDAYGLSVDDIAAGAKRAMNNRQTEVDVLNGMISKYGRELGIPTPFNDVMTIMVKCIQGNYDRQYLK